MADSKKPYDILVSREYSDGNGEVKNAYYRAGVAFENKAGGFNIEIVDGLALTGRAVILPRKDRAEDDGPSE
ncbi:hypothetical protein ABGN05_29655 [Aquibium sp. LZ166]|uniref:Uncharacterized protein n=1 Tax=Aquibium pacificus TaxID=3153579 RepID=A0ABV3SV56_9HYPH